MPDYSRPDYPTQATTCNQPQTADHTTINSIDEFNPQTKTIHETTGSQPKAADHTTMNAIDELSPKKKTIQVHIGPRRRHNHSQQRCPAKKTLPTHQVGRPFRRL
uniref:Uncharacterized protein n=1 Tax=Brassica oleracea TaxID=3712 RepID=A0A3P6FAB9_BRAOL|nr:unnamed protein product [Brassica oleracea]